MTGLVISGGAATRGAITVGGLAADTGAGGAAPRTCAGLTTANDGGAATVGGTIGTTGGVMTGAGLAATTVGEGVDATGSGVRRFGAVRLDGRVISSVRAGGGRDRTAACGMTGLGADGNVRTSRGWAAGGGGGDVFACAAATFAPDGAEGLDGGLPPPPGGATSVTSYVTGNLKGLARNHWGANTTAIAMRP